jgi:hypothetical protein
LATGSGSRRLPPAVIVDDDLDEDAILLQIDDRRPRTRRSSLQPYSSAEMRFFTEGEEMYEDEPPRN